MGIARNVLSAIKGEGISPSSVDTDEATIGNDPARKAVSENDRELTVGSDSSDDYSTIQAALDDVPLYLRHKYDITVDSTYTSNEDLVIRGVNCHGVNPDSGFSEGQLRIFGQGASVDSLRVESCIGRAGVIADNLLYDGEAPNIDENTVIWVSGSIGVIVRNADIDSDLSAVSSTTHAFVGYDSFGCQFENSNIADAVGVDHAMMAKGGSILRESGGTGQAADTAFKTNGGDIRGMDPASTYSGANGFHTQTRDGLLISKDNRVLTNVEVGENPDNAGSSFGVKLHDGTVSWELRNTGDEFKVLNPNGKAELEIRDGAVEAIPELQLRGGIKALNAGGIDWLGEDLTSRTPSGEEIAYHDGTGTPSASLCFESGSNWYNIVDGNTF